MKMRTGNFKAPLKAKTQITEKEPKRRARALPKVAKQKENINNEDLITSDESTSDFFEKTNPSRRRAIPKPIKVEELRGEIKIEDLMTSDQSSFGNFSNEDSPIERNIPSPSLFEESQSSAKSLPARETVQVVETLPGTSKASPWKSADTQTGETFRKNLKRKFDSSSDDGTNFSSDTPQKGRKRIHVSDEIRDSDCEETTASTERDKIEVKYEVDSGTSKSTVLLDNLDIALIPSPSTSGTFNHSPYSDVVRKSPSASASASPFAEVFRTPDNPPPQRRQRSSSVSTNLSQESNYSVAGSQATTRERLEWLRGRRMVGTWVQCDCCNKWRYLKDHNDPSTLPQTWECEQNPDANRNRCDVAEEQMTSKDAPLIIYNRFAPGSLVWAKLDGYPWWPAIVDDGPENCQFYKFNEGSMEVPSEYHVVFFSRPVSRDWIKAEKMLPYAEMEVKAILEKKNARLWTKELRAAAKTAQQAQRLDQLERIVEHGFLANFKGPLFDSSDEDHTP